MQHLFVEYPLALKLKEAGMNEPTLGYYDGHRLLRPSIQQVETLMELYEKADITVSKYDGYDKDDDVFIDFKANTFEIDVAAPIYQQVFDWLEGKGMSIQCRRIEAGYHCVVDYFKNHMMYTVKTEGAFPYFETRKQAWDRAIEEAQKLLKEKKENDNRPTGT